MKTLIKYISIVAVLLCFLCIATNVFAEESECYFTNDAGTTVMRGGVSLGQLQHITDVTVSVYDENGNLNFRSVLNVGKDGKADFSYINNGSNGNYTCYFAIRSLNEVKTVVCTDFKGHEYWEDFIDGCNTYAKEQKAADLVNLILENKDFLKIDTELYDVLDTPSAVEEIMLAGYFTKYPQLSDFISYTKTEDIVDAFEGAVFVAYINEKQNGDAVKTVWEKDSQKGVLDLAQKMPEGESFAVLDELSSVTRGAVYEAIAGKTYVSASELADEFITDTLFNTIKFADNYLDVKKVLLAYSNSGKLQISIGNSTTYIAVFKNMQKKSYTSFKDVEDAFKKYLETAGQSSSPSGSNGGGGGGGVFKPKTDTAGNINESILEGQENTGQSLTAPMYFNDIEDSKWALHAINYWYETGVISGNGYGGFEPTRNVNRSEMAKMLVGWREYEFSDNIPPFSDIEVGEWYVPYVATAYKEGLFNGYEDGSFGVLDGITRQEAACVIFRLISAEKTTPKKKAKEFIFEDDGRIADWAKEAVYSLYDVGVVNGRSEKTYAPDELMTRAEAAMLMYKAKQYLDA